MTTLALTEARATIEQRRERIERQLQSRIAAVFARQRRALNADALVRGVAMFYGVELSEGQLRVVREAQPIEDEIWAYIAANWPDAVEAIAVAISRDATLASRLVGNLTLATIGYRDSFTIGRAVRQRIATGSLVAARSIEQTSKARIRLIFERGFRERRDVRAIARAIRDEMDGWTRSRAEMVARTEVSEAWHATQYEVLARNGWGARVWLTAGDERVDAGGMFGPCIENEAAGPVPINQPFPSGDYWPPSHPSCRCTTAPAEGYGPDRLSAQPWTGGDEGGVSDVQVPPRTFEGA